MKKFRANDCSAATAQQTLLSLTDPFDSTNTLLSTLTDGGYDSKLRGASLTQL